MYEKVSRNKRSNISNSLIMILIFLFPVKIQARGGALNFFSGSGVRPVGLANWYLPLKRGACELKISKFGGLWTENFPIWGLVSWKFPNLEGLWAKVWMKIEAVEAKISKFSQKGVLWADSFAWNGTLANYRRGVKRGSSGPHIPYHLSRSLPPPIQVLLIIFGFSLFFFLSFLTHIPYWCLINFVVMQMCSQNLSGRCLPEDQNVKKWWQIEEKLEKIMNFSNQAPN